MLSKGNEASFDQIKKQSLEWGNQMFETSLQQRQNILLIIN